MSQPQGSEFTPEQRAQRDHRDGLARLCIFAVDSFVVDNYDDLKRITGADHNRLVVEAAIGSLLDNGLIAPEPVQSNGVRCTLPAHLVPDVAEAVERLRRINASLGGAR